MNYVFKEALYRFEIFDLIIIFQYTNIELVLMNNVFKEALYRVKIFYDNILDAYY